MSAYLRRMIRYRPHPQPLTIGELRRARHDARNPLLRLGPMIQRSGLPLAMRAAALIVAILGFILLLARL